jgi:uncharacterized membrane protein
MPYPIKLSLKSEAAPIILIVAAWIFAFYFYAHFPAQVVTHWGFDGQPNGYMGKAAGAFAIPALLAGIYALLLGLPWLDPKSNRYAEFDGVYHFFKTAIIFVLFAVYIASGFYNLGYAVNINVIVPLLIGLLMIVLGNFMGKIKRNWFVGVRTPWTLSSENVWNKTNRFGGFMMVLFGFLVIASPLLPRTLGLGLFIVGALLASVVTVLYSFLVYRKEQNQKAKVEVN